MTKEFGWKNSPLSSLLTICMFNRPVAFNLAFHVPRRSVIDHSTSTFHIHLNEIIVSKCWLSFLNCRLYILIYALFIFHFFTACSIDDQQCIVFRFNALLVDNLRRWNASGFLLFLVLSTRYSVSQLSRINENCKRWKN